MEQKVKRVNMLSTKQMFALCAYVKEHYTESGLPDDRFAVQAANALGFPVTKSNVYAARGATDTPASRLMAPRDTSIKARLLECERGLADLIGRLGKLEARMDRWEN